MICLDASIMIRLLTAPNNLVIRDKWNSWLESEVLLIAPALFYYEVTNGLYKYQRAGIFSKQTVAHQLAFALQQPVQLHNTTHLHEVAYQLAGQWGLAATYDAHYIALAKQFDCPMWTLDGKLAKKVKPYTNRVHLL